MLSQTLEDGIVSIGYEPRPQFLPFHNRSNRFACMVCHRRAGKTVACVHELGTRGIYTLKQNARFAYIAPFYKQAKDVAWQYLKDGFGRIGVVRESELRLVLPNGAWITLYGADNIDALRGLYLDGVVLDEYGDCRPGLWGEVIFPTLLDRKGWAVFIGTPKGNNHFKKTFDRSVKEAWFSMVLKASQSGILSQEDLDEAKRQMSDNEYQQEMECSFQAALVGSFWGDLMAKLEAANRITSVEHDPDSPVSVATDLGFTDSTAMWFWQVRSDGIAIIDYEEHHGKDLPFYYDILDKKGYKYETIWLPHDARAKTLQTGRSTLQQFAGQKTPLGNQKYPVRIAPKLDVLDGVNAARKVLPQCYFDGVKCYDGIEALKSYRREYDDIKRVYTNDERHDWSSHGASAFRYLSLVTQLPIMKADEEQKAQNIIRIRSIADMSFDELWKLRDKPKLSLTRRRRV